MANPIRKLVGAVRRHPYVAAVAAVGVAELVRARECRGTILGSVATTAAVVSLGYAGYRALGDTGLANPTGNLGTGPSCARRRATYHNLSRAFQSRGVPVPRAVSSQY